jgi:hypothetical protein
MKKLSTRRQGPERLYAVGEEELDSPHFFQFGRPLFNNLNKVFAQNLAIFSCISGRLVRYKSITTNFFS